MIDIICHFDASNILAPFFHDFHGLAVNSSLQHQAQARQAQCSPKLCQNMPKLRIEDRTPLYVSMTGRAWCSELSPCSFFSPPLASLAFWCLLNQDGSCECQGGLCGCRYLGQHSGIRGRTHQQSQLQIQGEGRSGGWNHHTAWKGPNWAKWG